MNGKEIRVLEIEIRNPRSGFGFFVFGGSEVGERGLNFESEKCLDL